MNSGVRERVIFQMTGGCWLLFCLFSLCTSAASMEPWGKPGEAVLQAAPRAGEGGGLGGSRAAGAGAAALQS